MLRRLATVEVSASRAEREGFVSAGSPWCHGAEVTIRLESTGLGRVFGASVCYEAGLLLRLG
jgi:hypothetical protein